MNLISICSGFLNLIIRKFLFLISSDIRKWYKRMNESKIDPKELYIKDSEPCPCGSNKLFIQCCKTNTDTGPIKSKKPTSVILNEEIKKSRNNKKICIHPDQTKCKGHIKQAHALQNHKILSLLAENTGHVYCIDKNKQPVILSEDPHDPIIIAMLTKTSVNTATTSTCFCDYHDTKAFSIIETGAPDFDINNEQMKFVYAYKAFAFDYYNFIAEFMSYRELFGKRPQVFTLPEQVAYYRMLQLKQAELDPIKTHYDNEILSGTYKGVHTCIVELPYQIRFANYAYIAPDFDIDGQLISHTKDGIMHRISFTVFPEKNKSYILMSCLDAEKEMYQIFFDKIINASIEKVTYYFSMILPLYSENLVLSKSLWESLDEMGQMGLTHLINLHGPHMVKMSCTLSIGLQNASKDNNFDYSKRTKIDLFT